jgi:hypothetical protein
MLPCSSQDLPAIRFALVYDVPNFGILTFEHFAKQKNCTLDRRQSFQQHQEGHRQGFVDFYDSKRIAAGIGNDRLREPFSDVLLASHASRLQVVDA